MKKKGSRIGAGLFFAGLVASAGAKPPEDKEICGYMDQMAEVTMTARQRGMPMAEMYKKTDAMPLGLAKVARDVIKHAYKTPRYPTENQRTQAVTDFRDIYFRVCAEDTP